MALGQTIPSTKAGAARAIGLSEKADADNFISVDTQKSLFTADAETPQLLQNNTPQAADNFARPSQAVA